MVADLGQTIILDAMAGPEAHNDIVLGAMRAQREGLAKICLVGDAALLEDTIRQQGGSLSDIECVHAPVFIGRRENAGRALKLKKDSSLQSAIELASHPNHSLISFGNASALRRLVGSRCSLPGRLCPFVTTVQTAHGHCTMLDVGPYTEVSARHLTEFGAMGAAFHRLRHEVDSPSIALLSGETVAANCSESVREAHRLFNENVKSYRGLLSGADWVEDSTDVAVTSAELGSFLSQMLHGQRLFQARPSKATDTPSFSWRTFFGARASQSLPPSAPVSPSSVILGADTLVLHRRFVVSDTNIYSAIRETVQLQALELVTHVAQALLPIDHESMRTTTEAPARTGS